jgi:NAD(P)-dependent dehydrogenase (short-subunit alcohol dehydrogenase family)
VPTGGIGKAFVEGLLAAGARKVYAGARNLADVTTRGVTPIKLDITNVDQVALAAEQCADINVLINNAGIAAATPFIASPELRDVKAMMDTNYFGTLNMCRAFAPVLKRNGGGALVNMLSAASWTTQGFVGGYSASKMAELALTRGVRIELRSQGTLVVGVYASFVDTDMTKSLAVPKARPEDIAAAVMSGLASRTEDILADDRSRELATNFVREGRIHEAMNQKAWDERLYGTQAPPE